MWSLQCFRADLMCIEEDKVTQILMAASYETKCSTSMEMSSRVKLFPIKLLI